MPDTTKTPLRRVRFWALVLLAACGSCQVTVRHIFPLFREDLVSRTLAITGICILGMMLYFAITNVATKDFFVILFVIIFGANIATALTYLSPATANTPWDYFALCIAPLVIGVTSLVQPTANFTVTPPFKDRLPTGSQHEHL